MADDEGAWRAIEAVVSGRVQGVGYRYTTQQVGRRLGLAGWVRNDIGGSVTVRAQGRDEVVSRFVDFLREGPPAARVSTVDVNEASVDQTLTNFTVRY